ncbi:MAG: PAS domain-containing sensor histidine kinase [Methanoregulaceae archaeon]|nr:PAS domain-containing sensor histidine kinase [Methanoregulaceae archaeon]
MDAKQLISADNDLKKSELQYRRLFETAQDGILILNGDTGEVIDANKFIIDLLGYPLEYFIGKHLWELGFITDKSIAQRAFSELKTNDYIRYEDIPLETKCGRSMEVEFISNLYLVGDEKIIQCNIRDITERKRTENELTVSRRKLNILSSITRHDINNQLMSVNGFLELLHEKIPDPDLADYFTRIMKASSRISAMILFAKEYEQIGLNNPVWQGIHSLVNSAALEATRGQVTVKNDLPCTAEVLADPLIIKVFYNLIDNAVRHGGKITTIRFSVETSGDTYLIVCEDDGNGVLVEEKEKIFERGFGKNTGLGLALSREILLITGMTIQETGEPGKGARFEIIVPKGRYR